MSKELDHLRKIAEAATPGPWAREGTGVLGAREAWDKGEGSARIMEAMMPWRRERMEANAEHAATFDPPTVLALIDRLEAAEQAVARVRALCLDTDGDPLDPDFDGNTVGDILRALDGEQS